MTERPTDERAAALKIAVPLLHAADCRGNVARKARLFGNDELHSIPPDFSQKRRGILHRTETFLKLSTVYHKNHTFATDSCIAIRRAV